MGHTPVIPALGWLRQLDCGKFEISLGYTETVFQGAPPPSQGRIREWVTLDICGEETLEEVGGRSQEGSKGPRGPGWMFWQPCVCPLHAALVFTLQLDLRNFGA